MRHDPPRIVRSARVWRDVRPAADLQREETPAVSPSERLDLTNLLRATYREAGRQLGLRDADIDVGLEDALHATRHWRDTTEPGPPLAEVIDHLRGEVEAQLTLRARMRGAAR